VRQSNPFRQSSGDQFRSVRDDDESLEEMAGELLVDDLTGEILNFGFGALN
jgi:hypothetical protein